EFTGAKLGAANRTVGIRVSTPAVFLSAGLQLSCRALQLCFSVRGGDKAPMQLLKLGAYVVKLSVSFCVSRREPIASQRRLPTIWSVARRQGSVCSGVLCQFIVGLLECC